MAVGLLLVVALALLCWSAWLMRDGTARALQERVRLASGKAAAVAVRAPTIRVADARHSGALARLARWLRYNPDVPPRLPLPATLVLGIAAGVFAGWRVAASLDPLLAPPAAVAVALLALRALFGWQAQAYAQTLFVQVPDALGFILRAVRAGLPVAEALRGLAREMPSPTKDEFARVVGELAIGRPLEQALWHLYERTRLTEYAFFAVTLGLQAQTGGSLAETLENLADIVRKRVAMRSRARALAAEARMSAIILMALPFVAGLGLMLLSPGYMDVFFGSAQGRQLLMTGLTLLGLGLLTIRWLIRRSTAD